MSKRRHTAMIESVKLAVAIAACVDQLRAMKGLDPDCAGEVEQHLTDAAFRSLDAALVPRIKRPQRA